MDHQASEKAAETAKRDKRAGSKSDAETPAAELQLVLNKVPES
jgi:hypothetical protein